MKRVILTAAALFLLALSVAGRNFVGANSNAEVVAPSPQSDSSTARQSTADRVTADKDAAASFAFAVIGDSGTGHKAQYEVAQQMKLQHAKVPFDTVIMCGDNIYPDGNPIW